MKKSLEISGQVNIKAIAKRKARDQFEKFKKALEEVAQIEAGLIKPKTLQQVLNDL